jgi:hypothetical protein
MLHPVSPMSEIATLRARFDGLRVLTAAIRLQLAIKANFNPNQPRIPFGQPGGGQWTNGDGFTQLVADKSPPLRRLHPDSTYERDQIAKGSLDYWRRQSTDKIVDSLKPGARRPLVVEADGTIRDGNTRIRVLQERGYDVDSLPRVPYNDPPSPSRPPRRGGRGGGGGGIGPPPGAGRFPRI